AAPWRRGQTAPRGPSMIAPRTPEEFEQQRRQAHAALRAGRAATAEAWLRALEAQFPGEVNCLRLLGVALLEQDKIADSIALLERVLAGAPDFAHARIDLARAYRRDGRAARSREEVRRAPGKTPPPPRPPPPHRAGLAYGDALAELGQYADAALAFERARLTDPYRPQVEEGTAAMVAQDRKQAELIFRDILRRDASHVAALCGLAALSLAAAL